MSYPYPVEEIANFEADMAELLASIREHAQDDFTAGELTAPHVPELDGGPNPYFERENYAGTRDHYTTYDYVAFRDDIEELIRRLEGFVDGTKVEHFDEINEDLLAIKDLLELAQGADVGMHNLKLALEGWVAGAAVNFRDVVINPFGRVLLRQANLAKELATAALSYKAIVEHARADSLSLASQLDKKLDLSGGGFGISLDQVLFVAGAVASGVALVTGGPVAWPAVIAFAANTARGVASITAAEAEEYAVDGIASRAGGESTEELTITGVEAREFVPSTQDEILRVWQAARDQDELIKDGLQDDLAALRDDEQLTLVVTEPELVTADEYADLGMRGEVHIEDIVELKKAGVAYLPAVAQQLHAAVLKLAGVRGLFDSAFGDALFVVYKYWFRETVDQLDTALTQCRDFLYQSGLNLSTIADNYVETDLAIQAEFDAMIAEQGIPDGYDGRPEDFAFQDLVDLHLEDFPQEVYRGTPTGYY